MAYSLNQMMNDDWLFFISYLLILLILLSSADFVTNVHLKTFPCIQGLVLLKTAKDLLLSPRVFVD